jgi:hypothetical protein
MLVVFTEQRRQEAIVLKGKCQKISVLRGPAGYGSGELTSTDA